MANKKNLKPFTSEQSRREAAKNGAKGGKASGEARRRKRDLRLALEVLLERDYKDKFGNEITGAEALAAKLFEQGMNGNVRAFETIRATVGQDPVQKVMIAEIDPEVVNEVERAVLDEQS